MEICRLCLELLQGNSFTKLGDSYKCIVNNVIPEVDLEITSSPVICNQCTSSIDELHKFKLLCFESQQKIKRNSNKCRDSQLTLKQILDGPDVNKMVVTDLVKARICRTCLESVESESFTILKPSNPDAYLESMLSMCLPEVDLQISQDPIMCENCLNCLQKFHQLKTTCLDVEEKLAKYKKQQGTSVESPINLHKVYEILQDPKSEKPKFDNIVDIKSETIDENCETNNKDVENEYASQDLSSALVKQEDMDIKSEEECQWSEEDKNVNKKKPNKLDEIMKQVLKNHKQETHYSCSQCAFTMANKRHYVMHMLTTHTTFNEETRLMHFCHLCDYKTMYKDQMKKHIESDHMEKEKLHCPFCSFTSIYAVNLKRHISIHEDMQDLTCSHPQCDFKTSYKYSLQRHEIKIHGNQCSICQYKNRNRTAIQRHLRTVHGIYEIHHCDKCTFKTFYLTTLKRHNAREHKGMMKSNFTSVKKRKDELTAEEEEEIKLLFKD